MVNVNGGSYVKTDKEYRLSERFEVAYNLIHDALKQLVDEEEDRFTVLLRLGESRHHLIHRYYEDLKQYGKLRNAIVHEKRQPGLYIAEPNEEVVKHIEKIATIFSKPVTGLTIATKDVKFFEQSQPLKEVLEAIQQHGYSQYPIYDEKKYVGLLKTTHILSWMSNTFEQGNIQIVDQTVGDLIPYMKEAPIEFVSKHANIFEVEAIFEEKHRRKIDLEAVIVNENGKENEWPLGLITPWDLIEIDYTID